MAQRKSLLLVDAGADPLEPITLRFSQLGFHVVRAKTTHEAREALLDRRFVVGAIVVPPDLPAADFERSLHAFRSGGHDGELPMLVCGRKPDAARRDRLRRAGAEHALWWPIDDHLLRFQANRALAGFAMGKVPRKSERVPTNWPVQFRISGRENVAKLYSVSARGGFLTTSRPSLPRTILHVNLPRPEGDVRVAAEVVMTNVPGNLVKANLPIGMGVRFRGLDVDTEASLLAFTLARRDVLKV